MDQDKNATLLFEHELLILLEDISDSATPRKVTTVLNFHEESHLPMLTESPVAKRNTDTPTSVVESGDHDSECLGAIKPVQADSSPTAENQLQCKTIDIVPEYRPDMVIQVGQEQPVLSSTTVNIDSAEHTVSSIGTEIAIVQ